MAEIKEIKLQEIHDLLVTVSRNAAQIILSANPTTLASGTKKNSADLVTETDQAVEKMLTKTLKSAYPSFEFIGEETYKPGMKLTDAPTFIVDPIDGTTNFVHGFPSVCISLGFALNKCPTVGVVHNPFTNTLYTAIKGRGAYLYQGTQPPQKLPLRPHPEPFTNLSTCLIATEWGSDRSGSNYDLKTRVFNQLAAAKDHPKYKGSMVHSIRSLGSAALNICGVAAGYLDLYWEGGCWAWDVCAGWVILEEAGGLMVDGNPGGWEPEVEGRTYLAVRKGEGQRGLVEEFWGVVGDGRLVYEG